nr:hypothetical protein [uncultured bacterium]
MQKVYRINGVSIEIADPLGSSLVLDGDVPGGRCPECRDFSQVPPHALIVQGYDDMQSIDVNMRGFLSPCPPLTTTRERAKELSDIITGVEYVEVGYSSWDQGPDLFDADRFSRPPFLGSLYVTSMTDGFYWNDGQPIKRCPRCDSPKGFDFQVGRNIGNLRLSKDKYPETDVFFLKGGSRKLTTFITHDGAKKIESTGYTNLVLQEAFWGE